MWIDEVLAEAEAEGVKELEGQVIACVRNAGTEHPMWEGLHAFQLDALDVEQH
jgi:hypothetical protein